MDNIEKSILDIFAEERLYNKLENVLQTDEKYQLIEKELEETIDKLEKSGLSREQNKIVDKALSVTNSSGAVYGEVAYKQGRYDGIKLMLEINQISEIEIGYDFSKI